MLWGNCCLCSVYRFWNDRRPRIHFWVFSLFWECFCWESLIFRVWFCSHCRTFRSCSRRYCNRWMSLSIHSFPVLRRCWWWHRRAVRSPDSVPIHRNPLLSLKMLLTLLLDSPSVVESCLNITAGGISAGFPQAVKAKDSWHIKNKNRCFMCFL